MGSKLALRGSCGEHRTNLAGGLFRQDGKIVVVASFAGRPENPAWYFNLVANPAVTAEVYEGGELTTIEVQAQAVSPGAPRGTLAPDHLPDARFR